jgi:hypothetical protein
VAQDDGVALDLELVDLVRQLGLDRSSNAGV